jgi:hypothetical protein
MVIGYERRMNDAKMERSASLRNAKCGVLQLINPLLGIKEAEPVRARRIDAEMIVREGGCQPPARGAI